MTYLGTSLVANFLTTLFEHYLFSFLYFFTLIYFYFGSCLDHYISHLCVCSFITSRKEIIPLAQLVLSMLTATSSILLMLAFILFC